MRIIYLLPFLIAAPAFACNSTPEEKFNMYDHNNDGVVVLEEYLFTTSYDAKSYTKKTETEKQNLIKLRRESFEKYDTDKDEKIDKNEGLKLPHLLKCRQT